MRRPEYVLAASWVFAAQLMFALSVALAHGPRLYLLALFIMPLLLWSVAFPAKAAAVAVVITAALMTLTALLTDPHTVAQDRSRCCSHSPGWSRRRSRRRPCAICTRSRARAVVDQLTGLLNRVALEARVAEVTHRTTITGRQVALIIGDIDHFKAINDAHGHARGDEVLKEVAARLRTRSKDEPVFRLGGEEFLVLLADVDTAEAQNVAERLRGDVRHSPVDGLRVTMSFGVASSPPDVALDYEDLFARADAALYRAKHDGRDRVAGAPRVPVAPPTSPRSPTSSRRPRSPRTSCPSTAAGPSGATGPRFRPRPRPPSRRTRVTVWPRSAPLRAAGSSATPSSASTSSISAGACTSATGPPTSSRSAPSPPPVRRSVDHARRAGAGRDPLQRRRALARPPAPARVRARRDVARRPGGQRLWA